MANVQEQFEAFHKAIRTYYEINKTLREKKDIIVERVKRDLEKKNRPSCSPFIQGSYKMKVGVCALPGMDFDIDVGLMFGFEESKHQATDVRDWVYEAVKDHTETVEKKGPCIRVVYKDGYHVDLVSYAMWDDAAKKSQYRLAHKTKGWRAADPPALVEHVKSARAPFKDTEDGTQTDQFRRVVRYLKRWNDIAIREESNDKPSGLALVLLTERHLTTPRFDWRGSYDDRAALEAVAVAAAQTTGRISVTKPTPENEDMFGRISELAMTDLKKRFGGLASALAYARDTANAKDACVELQKVLGDDFPLPDEGDGGKAKKSAAPAIVPSSSSA